MMYKVVLIVNAYRRELENSKNSCAEVLRVNDEKIIPFTDMVKNINRNLFQFPCASLWGKNTKEDLSRMVLDADYSLTGPISTEHVPRQEYCNSSVHTQDETEITSKLLLNNSFLDTKHATLCNLRADTINDVAVHEANDLKIISYTSTLVKESQKTVIQEILREPRQNFSKLSTTGSTTPYQENIPDHLEYLHECNVATDSDLNNSNQVHGKMAELSTDTGKDKLTEELNIKSRNDLSCGTKFSTAAENVLKQQSVCLDIDLMNETKTCKNSEVIETIKKQKLNECTWNAQHNNKTTIYSRKRKLEFEIVEEQKNASNFSYADIFIPGKQHQTAKRNQIEKSDSVEVQNSALNKSHASTESVTFTTNSLSAHDTRYNFFSDMSRKLVSIPTSYAAFTKKTVDDTLIDVEQINESDKKNSLRNSICQQKIIRAQPVISKVEHIKNQIYLKAEEGYMKLSSLIPPGSVDVVFRKTFTSKYISDYCLKEKPSSMSGFHIKRFYYASPDLFTSRTQFLAYGGDVSSYQTYWQTKPTTINLYPTTQFPSKYFNGNRLSKAYFMPYTGVKTISEFPPSEKSTNAASIVGENLLETALKTNYHEQDNIYKKYCFGTEEETIEIEKTFLNMFAKSAEITFIFAKQFVIASAKINDMRLPANAFGEDMVSDEDFLINEIYNALIALNRRYTEHTAQSPSELLDHPPFCYKIFKECVIDLWHRFSAEPYDIVRFCLFCVQISVFGIISGEMGFVGAPMFAALMITYAISFYQNVRKITTFWTDLKEFVQKMHNYKEFLKTPLNEDSQILLI